MMRDLIDGISAALGLAPEIERLPMPPRDDLWPQPGDVKRTYADIAKAQALLGYAPDTPIEEGLAQFGDWVKTHYAERPLETEL